MALLDFIQRLLGLQKPSATLAKERLQLVLAHDRSDLNPELLDRMRREILEVVQKYVEIDLEGGEVNLLTEDRVTALVANLPIRRARAIPTSPSPELTVPQESSADSPGADPSTDLEDLAPEPPGEETPAAESGGEAPAPDGESPAP